MSVNYTMIIGSRDLDPRSRWKLRLLINQTIAPRYHRTVYSCPTKDIEISVTVLTIVENRSHYVARVNVKNRSTLSSIRYRTRGACSRWFNCPRDSFGDYKITRVPFKGVFLFLFSFFFKYASTSSWYKDFRSERPSHLFFFHRVPRRRYNYPRIYLLTFRAQTVFTRRFFLVIFEYRARLDNVSSNRLFSSVPAGGNF